jgi:hypothetical protein
MLRYGLLQGLGEVCCSDPDFVYPELSGVDSGEGALCAVTKVFVCDACLGGCMERASRGRFQSMLQTNGRREEVEGGRWEVRLTICP